MSGQALLVWVLRGCFLAAALFCIGYAARRAVLEWKGRRRRMRCGRLGDDRRWFAASLIAYGVVVACLWIGPKVGWDT